MSESLTSKTIVSDLRAVANDDDCPDVFRPAAREAAAEIERLQQRIAELEQYQEWAAPQVVHYGEQRLRIAELERLLRKCRKHLIEWWRHEGNRSDSEAAPSWRIAEEIDAVLIGASPQSHEPSPPSSKTLLAKFKKGDVVRWNAPALHGAARDGWVISRLEVKNSLLPIYRVRKGTKLGSAQENDLELMQ